jgi:murein DD-endopeptidase MepM/ murein hydrolase activator NlpD
MRIVQKFIGIALVAWAAIGNSPSAGAQVQFDSTPVWPLCGRISEDPPKRWKVSKGCPSARFGNPAFHDGPISSSFGPRQLVSGNFRYDFHRGLDIPTPVGTPVFAFADGVVRKAGSDPSYTDPLVQLRHYRPGFSGSCTNGGGCYVTNYLHMSEAAVAIGDSVSKGELIGYSGASSATNFAHVHFEVRNAPPQDPFSGWQRDTIHPLQVLPYPDSGATNIQLTLDDVDATNPLQPIVQATVIIPLSVELDFERLEVEIHEKQPDGSLLQVVQPGDSPVGNTIEGTGYFVEPSWYSLNSWNRQYSYKNSSGIPWSSFEQGGIYESPYWSDLPSSYDPNVHLDVQDPNNYQVGLFNGLSVAPIHYNANSSEYRVSYSFLALTGVPDAANLCVRIRALDVLGNATSWRDNGCTTALIITSAPITDASEGSPYAYQATAAGDQPIDWSLEENPAGMAVDSSTGLVTWSQPDPGLYSVGLRATNWAGTDLQSYFLDVSPATPQGCGDGACSVGESCDGRDGTESCSVDCPGKIKGKPSNRFCYVDGVCEGPGC